MRVFTALTMAMCMFAGSAHAERLKIVVMEPTRTKLDQPLVDLKECTVFIRQGTGVLAQQTYQASGPTGGQQREIFFTDLNPLRAMTGVLQSCRDLSGGLSPESAVRSFTFSDGPRAGSVEDVQLVP